MSDAQELLLKAAEVLGERGWCQGELENEDGNVCAVGAVRLAHYTDAPRGLFREDRFLDAMDLFYQSLGIGSGMDVPDWNDAPGRTAEDVILALKHAATMES